MVHKRYSTSLIIGEIQIKTTVFPHTGWKGYYQKISTGEDVEKREPWYTVGGNVNWCSFYGKQYRHSTYDPAVLLLGIYPKKTKTLT